jgi:hypothetical protein
MTWKGVVPCDFLSPTYSSTPSCQPEKHEILIEKELNGQEHGLFKIKYSQFMTNGNTDGESVDV